jgi:hypothetical protein
MGHYELLLLGGLEEATSSGELDGVRDGVLAGDMAASASMQETVLARRKRKGSDYVLRP